MRKLIPLIFIAIAIPALAQSQARPIPKGSTPLDAPLPPPKVQDDPELIPKVSTRTEPDRKVEEFRVKGKLYKMKVTPAKGKPYWLIDGKGEGNFIRSHGPDL